MSVQPIEIDITIEDDTWSSALPDYESICTHAVAAVSNHIPALKNLDICDLSIVLTDNESIRALNKDYRGKDKPTNVLSFPQEDLSPDSLSEIENGYSFGDIICALEIIKDEADQQEKTLADHFTHLVIHGFLHLLGYDHIHDDDAAEMETMEIAILDDLGINNPYEKA